MLIGFLQCHCDPDRAAMESCQIQYEHDLEEMRLNEEGKTSLDEQALVDAYLESPKSRHMTLEEFRDDTCYVRELPPE